MTDDELLALIKQNIPVTTTAYDAELTAWMKAAQTDIARTIGQPFDYDDEIQVVMVVLSVRGNFGEGDQAALERYRSMLIKLGIQETY